MVGGGTENQRKNKVISFSFFFYMSACWVGLLLDRNKFCRLKKE
jgi:hypothetical protein